MFDVLKHFSLKYKVDINQILTPWLSKSENCKLLLILLSINKNNKHQGINLFSLRETGVQINITVSLNKIYSSNFLGFKLLMNSIATWNVKLQILFIIRWIKVLKY